MHKESVSKLLKKLLTTFCDINKQNYLLKSLVFYLFYKYYNNSNYYRHTNFFTSLIDIKKINLIFVI